jgi:hypothetical protein
LQPLRELNYLWMISRDKLCMHRSRAMRDIILPCHLHSCKPYPVLLAKIFSLAAIQRQL